MPMRAQSNNDHTDWNVKKNMRDQVAIVLSFVYDWLGKKQVFSTNHSEVRQS